MWHVAKCPKVVAGLIFQVEMTLWALRALLELGMQPCARHGNFYTPRTPERTYGVNQVNNYICCVTLKPKAMNSIKLIYYPGSMGSLTQRVKVTKPSS